jgi:uncharacterized protein YbjQ (UPF0145 family)
MTMLVTTTFSIEGYRIREYKGVARGIIVRTPMTRSWSVGRQRPSAGAGV